MAHHRKSVSGPEEIIANVFWRPNLTFRTFTSGEVGVVSFESLWLTGENLRHLLLETFANTELGASRELMYEWAVTVAPAHVLEFLLKFNLIEKDQLLMHGQTLLHLAVIAQRKEIVSLLLTNGFSPNVTNSQEETAEDVCCNVEIQTMLSRMKKRSGAGVLPAVLPSFEQLRNEIFRLSRSAADFDLLQIQLQTQAVFDVNKEKNSDGDFLIHTLVRQGLRQLPQLLTISRLQHADVNAMNDEGLTPLALAATLGHSMLIDVLICVLCSDPNIVDPRKNWAPLHYASDVGNFDSVSVLLKRGADMNVEDAEGRRADDLALAVAAVDCANVTQQYRICRACQLATKCKQESITVGDVRTTDLCIVDDNEFTLLMTAVLHNQRSNVSLLLGMPGCPMDAQNLHSGQTAFSLAAAAGHTTICKTLYSHGANANVRDIAGLTPLHHAIRNEHHDTVKFLLSLDGCLVGLKEALKSSLSYEMQVAVRVAMERRQSELVTPTLRKCAVTGDAQALFCLLEDGDDVNVQDNFGTWPVYVAVQNGHVDVLALLVQFGGDASSSHRTSILTPLHVAAQSGHLNIVKFLISHRVREANVDASRPSGGRAQNVDVNSVCGSGYTALQLAAERGYTSIVEALLDAGATTALLQPTTGALYKCVRFEGVQALLEKAQKRHTDEVMSCLYRRKRWPPHVWARKHEERMLHRLTSIWQAPFDHALRDRKGNTPLMVACRHSSLRTVKFLLASVVQPTQSSSAAAATHWQAEAGAWMEETMQDSGTVLDAQDHIGAEYLGRRFSQSYSENLEHDEVEEEPWQTLSSSSRQSLAFHTSLPAHIVAAATADSRRHSLPHTELAQDALLFADSWRWDRGRVATSLPRGHAEKSGCFSQAGGLLSPHMLHEDGVINHLHAINPRNGRTAFHEVATRTDKNGVAILACLLAVDSGGMNAGDKNGLTPLHVAASMGDTSMVRALLKIPEVDAQLKTNEGLFAEELAKGWWRRRLLRKAREACLHDDLPMTLRKAASSEAGYSSVGTTTLDFDNLHDRFQALKHSISSSASKRTS